MSHVTDGYTVMILEGSEGIEIGYKLARVAFDHGQRLAQGESVYFIPCDDHLSPPHDPDIDRVDRALLAGIRFNFKEMKLPDRESRRRLVKTGLLWFLLARNIEEAGVREDGMGTGNNPSWGRVLLRANSLEFRNAVTQGVRLYQDHHRRLEKAQQGGGDKRALNVVIVLSNAGGLGNGAFLDSIFTVWEVAAELHVPVKITLALLDTGTLPLPNREVNLKNRTATLNLVRAFLSGYRDPEGRYGTLDGGFVHVALISANCGPVSELTSLDELEGDLVHKLFHYLYSPMGLRLREDGVDLEENTGVDDEGAPRKGSAMGHWLMHLNRKRIATHCAGRLGHLFSKALLEAPADAAFSKGAAAAGQLQLEESATESETVQYLTKAGPTDPDAYQEVAGGFADRCAHQRGWEGLRAVDAAYQAMVADALLHVEVRMRRRAGELVSAVWERWQKELAAFGLEFSGLIAAGRFLEGILSLVETSDRFNTEKLSAVQEAQQAPLRRVDACRRAMARLSRAGFIGRLLRFITIPRTLRLYQSAADQLLRLEVERLARLRLHAEVYLPIQTSLMAELARLQALQANLEGAGEALRRRAEAALNEKPSVLEIPSGLDLSDASMQAAFFDARIQDKGGLTGLIGKLFGDVIQDDSSLFSFLDRTKDDLAERIAACTEKPFREEIDTLNVLETFRERRGGRTTAILSRAVKESMPRLQAVGEANLEIPTVKLLGVPEGCDADGLHKEVTRLDHSPGPWEIVHLPAGWDSIVFLTYRSQVSLTMLIEQGKPAAGPRNAEERIYGAVDPLLALIPVGRLTEEDVMVVAAYASLGEILSFDAASGYTLHALNGKERRLGRTPPEVLESLRRDFREVCHVYSVLGDALRDRPDQLRMSCRALQEAMRTRERTPISGLLSERTLNRVVDEIETVEPFLRQLPKRETT